MDRPEAISTENTEKFRAFVGPNWAEYYQGEWTPILTGKGRSAPVNWAAFSLAGFWLPYRKMYLATVIFYGVSFLLVIIEDGYFIGIRGFAETPGAVILGHNLLLALICGRYGNEWYLLHAAKLIDVVGEKGLQQDTFLETLSNRGGRSLVAGIGVPILSVIVLGIVYVVLVEPILL